LAPSARLQFLGPILIVSSYFPGVVAGWVASGATTFAPVGVGTAVCGFRAHPAISKAKGINRIKMQSFKLKQRTEGHLPTDLLSEIIAAERLLGKEHSTSLP
jgi:hypothetical protein